MSQHDANSDAAPEPEESAHSEQVDGGQPEQVDPEAPDANTPDVEPEQADEQPESQGNPELQAAREEAAQLKDQYARLQAEMENVRKRAERDVESAHKFGVEKFAKELLGVTDSLEAGLASANESGADLDKLREGMEMTERMLLQAMEKFGVESVNPEGEAFNPEYHEAMSMQPSSEHAPNTVVTVIQKGYLLHGRVLRPAMVIVSSAPPEGEADKE